ncbi:hypothetical protein ACJ41O_013517 [Fusarium nematophilum]
MAGFRSGLSASILLLLTTIHALQFTPDSECAALCTDGSNSTSTKSNPSQTNATDIVCEDDDFKSSGTGIRFKNCINCLQKSEDTWEDESDVYWFLYNVRYAFDVCLYSYPDEVESGTINSPCNIEGACGALEDALEESLLDVNNDNQFDYCEADNSVLDSSSYRECISCLRSTSSQKYLANFLVALKAGCKQRPEPGDVIGLSDQIFTPSAINITDPKTNETLPGDGGAPVGAMTTGTIVGIAVGSALGFVSLVYLLWLYCRRSRREGEKIDSPAPDAPMNHRPSYGIQKSSYFSGSSGRSASSTPDPKRPGDHARSLSNAEYYDMLEQGVRSQQPTPVNYHYAPHSVSNGPNGALPAHHAYIPRVASRLGESNSPTPPRNTLRTNTPDSYALQTYLSAGHDASADPTRVANAASYHSAASSLAGSRNPSPARQPLNAEPSPAVPAPAATTRSKIPNFAFPSLTKLVIPGKHAARPPQLNVQEATPLDEPKPDMNISNPLAIMDPRFTDKPLGGGPVLATEPPAGFNEAYSKRLEDNRSPLLSGNSRIYG